MSRALLAAVAVLIAAPAAYAEVPDCLNRPPWIDTRDPIGTVKGAVPDCF